MKADENTRAIWLASSNVMNRGLYNSLGFRIVDTIELGKYNPSWKLPPVMVDVVRAIKL
jgi:hypothetical protein